MAAGPSWSFFFKFINFVFRLFNDWASDNVYLQLYVYPLSLHFFSHSIIFRLASSLKLRLILPNVLILIAK